MDDRYLDIRERIRLKKGKIISSTSERSSNSSSQEQNGPLQVKKGLQGLKWGFSSSSGLIQPSSKAKSRSKRLNDGLFLSNRAI